MKLRFRGFVESIGRALPWWGTANLAGELEGVFCRLANRVDDPAVRHLDRVIESAGPIYFFSHDAFALATSSVWCQEAISSAVRLA
jgi:hypothetical protein